MYSEGQTGAKRAVAVGGKSGSEKGKSTLKVKLHCFVKSGPNVNHHGRRVIFI